MQINGLTLDIVRLVLLLASLFLQDSEKEDDSKLFFTISCKRKSISYTFSLGVLCVVADELSVQSPDRCICTAKHMEESLVKHEEFCKEIHDS